MAVVDLPSRIKSPDYDVKLIELHEHIVQLNNAFSRLPDDEICKKYPGFLTGWRVVVETCDRAFYVDYLINSSFPYSRPKVAVPEYRKEWNWPHVESDNLLCLYEDEQLFSISNPIGVFTAHIERFVEFVEETLAGREDETVAEELVTYWQNSLDENCPKAWSLLEPKEPTRLIHIAACPNENEILLCDKLHDGMVWLNRRFPNHRKLNQPAKIGLLIWLEKPPMVRRRKHTNRELLEWLGDLPSTDLKTIKRGLKHESAVIVIAYRVSTGICMVALKITPKRQISRRASRREVVNELLSEDRSYTRLALFRIDHAWVHGRDNNQQAKVLRQKRVAIIGCGALGSKIASLIAEAGVGEIKLIDFDCLEPANIGRHFLGMEAVGQPKVFPLAQQLGQAYPHLKVTHSNGQRWEYLMASDPETLKRSDLIVCTTGSSQTELLLDSLAQSSQNLPTIIYGWTEPHALVGHAVVVPRTGSFADGFDDMGAPHLTASSWPSGKEIIQVPGCGNTFQPTGTIRLSNSVSLIADTCLKQLLNTTESMESKAFTWLGSTKELKELGGHWSQKWVDEIGDPGQGFSYVERPWNKMSD